MYRSDSSRNSSKDEKMSPPPPPENRALYVILLKDLVEPDRPQMTIYYGACALHTG